MRQMLGVAIVVAGMAGLLLAATVEAATSRGVQVTS